MRYRKLDSNGDYSFGFGAQNFFVNNNQAVAQAIQTALALFQGEWFLNVQAGVPWLTQVVGYNTQSLYDQVIKNAILGVEGVQAITSYSSSLNRTTRLLTVNATVTTIFDSTVTIIASLPGSSGGYGVGGYGNQGGYGL